LFAAIATLAIALAGGASFANASSTGETASLTGAGSTFVFPLVSKWMSKYRNARITYGAIGSGGGIAAISGRTVDFGASDAPLTPDQASGCRSCVQIPWALSATSIPYNVPGVSYGLKLTGPILADIYLGKIKNWDDRRIKQLNPGVKLPHLKVVPVYRSDASGTSFNFTDYLSRVSSEWKRKVGRGTQPAFPKGIGAKGSSGVSGTLSHTDGAITYVDIAYSLKNHFKVAKIKNSAGKFQLPGLRGIGAAAATVTRVPSNNAISIVNPPASKPTAYPICTFTWVIVPKKTKKASDLKRFIGWAVTSGQRYGQPLLFYPLPKVVVRADQKTLKQIHT
jgi:phosphate transport system substrate-binding protein